MGSDCQDLKGNLNSWDKKKFISEVSAYMRKVGNTNQDEISILILAENIDTFVTCTREIEKNGLIVIHSNGVAGKNHHFEIRDKSLSKIITLMSELGLTPKRRKASPSPRDDDWDAFLKGPSYYAKYKESKKLVKASEFI